MTRARAVAGGLLAVVVLAVTVVSVHAQHAPAPSPFGSSSASSPSSAPSSYNAPAGAPTMMEMETLLLAPGKASSALGGGPAGAPQQEDSIAAAPAAFAPFFSSGESPEESPAGAPQTIALVPSSIADAPQDYYGAPYMAPDAFSPLGSESPEFAPAGSPEAWAEAPGGPASEMAAAPSSEDYDVLEEEALAPAGEALSGKATPATEAAVSASPAEAPGPASDDDHSGASATATRRSLAGVVLFAAVAAVAAF